MVNLLFVRFVVDDFLPTYRTYAAVLDTQSGRAGAEQHHVAKLWNCQDPVGAELEIWSTEQARNVFGVGARSDPGVTLVFNTDDVWAASAAFVRGGATVVEPPQRLNAAGAARALLRDPTGLLVEVSRAAVASFGTFISSDEG